MYQPILPITYAILSKNGVRRCYDKNKLVAFSLSLNPVHFLHPEGKLRRGGAMQEKKPSVPLHPSRARASRRLEAVDIPRVILSRSHWP